MAHPKPDPAPIVLIPALIGGVLTARTQDPLGLGEGGEAPDAVTDLAAGTPAATSVTLTFTLPAGATATFYRRDVTAGGEYEQIATGVAVGSYTPTGLTDENAYQFKNTLTNAYGTSADSNVVSVTTAELGESPLILSGSFTHGGAAKLTTDGSHSFGTRTSAKPVYVYAGENSTAGSSLGRDTGSYFHANNSYQTSQKSGGFAGAMRFDFKLTSQGSFGGLEAPNNEAPIIIYKHIYRDFDQDNPIYQNEANGFNLKTHRFAASGDFGGHNFYVGRDGFGFVEYVDGNVSRWYEYEMPTFEWADELLYFVNSTAANTMDGRFYHTVDNVWLNSSETNSLLITFDDGSNSEKLDAIFLDQMSNGVGSGVSEVNQYLEYLLIDDEPRMIWIGDASTIGACTKLYPTPTVTWADTEIDFVPLFADIAPENAYVYISTSWDRETNVKTWVTTDGVQPTAGEALEVVGTFAQGNTITIATNGAHNFGTRASKALLVFDGTNKAGSSWGRDTTNYWQAAATVVDTHAVGEMPNSVRWDFKGTNAAIMNELIPFDPDKLYRQSTARFYAFDITEDQYQNSSGGFNLKTDRWWKDESVSLADLYIGYQGSEGGTSCRIAVEGIDNGANYTGITVPPFSWTQEIMEFKNSSAVNVPDGFCKHYRNGVWTNSETDPEDLYADKWRFITKSDAYPLGMSAKAFDQVSNGSGDGHGVAGATNVYMYFGYLVIDDEVSGVFVSDQPTISADADLAYQLPHDNWTATSIDVLALCPIPAADAYIYIRLANGSYVSTTGLKAVPA